MLCWTTLWSWPTLTQHWVNLSCLLGSLCIVKNVWYQKRHVSLLITSFIIFFIFHYKLVIQQLCMTSGAATQQTRDVHLMLVWCWPSVADDGPASTQCWVSIWCLWVCARWCTDSQNDRQDDMYTTNTIGSLWIELFLYKPWRPNGYFQFKTIIKADIFLHKPWRPKGYF